MTGVLPGRTVDLVCPRSAKKAAKRAMHCVLPALCTPQTMSSVGATKHAFPVRQCAPSELLLCRQREGNIA